MGSPPPSNLYTQLGQTSVSFFFMISSFSFLSKLINLKKEEFNWKSFFVSRFFRIYPLYLFSFLMLVIIVMQISGWEIQVVYCKYIRSVLKWLFFTFFGNESINNQGYTSGQNHTLLN